MFIQDWAEYLLQSLKNFNYKLKMVKRAYCPYVT